MAASYLPSTICEIASLFCFLYCSWAQVAGTNKNNVRHIRTGKEIRFRFWLSEDKAGKEAKRRPTGW